MKVDEKLRRAKIEMMLQQPFFATPLLSLPLVEDPGCKTASTNGKRIRYNPAYVEGLTLKQTAGLLAHETMHVTNLHHTRMGGRSLKRWNVACDHAINLLLTASGMELPRNGYCDPRYADMSAEHIYNLLSEMDEDEAGGGDPGGDGGVEPFEGSPVEREEVEEEVRKLVNQAMAAAQRAGRYPAHLDRAIREALRPKVNWREVLSRFLTELARNDYSFRFPNRRFLHTGFYLPSLYNEEVGEIILFVDTSGSITEAILNMVAAEIQQILAGFHVGFTVVYIDATVAGVEEIAPDSEVKLTPKGGGGTDFRPGFDWIKTEGRNPRAVVYFTDGVCHQFAETPEFPVLWCKYGTYGFTPPYGEVVQVTE